MENQRKENRKQRALKCWKEKKGGEIREMQIDMKKSFERPARVPALSAFTLVSSKSKSRRSFVDGDGVGSTQRLQLLHHGGMDHDGLHPADRPPFICGLISYSAVTSSPEKT